VSGVEKMLRPARRSQERRKIWKKKWFRVLVLLLIVVSLFYALVFQGDSSGRIVVGHKHFTEQRILGSLLSQYLKKEGNKEAYPIELGGTQLNFEALANGEIDLYVEYTGTAYQSILSQKKPLNSNDQSAYVRSNLLSKYGIEIAAQLGFNNTYTLSMMPELAERLGVDKISDLKKLNGRLTLGSSSEFLDRPDGLPGIKDVYGITFGEVKLLEIGLRYEALVNGEVDLIDAYSTDGRLQKFNLRVLQDDEGFFPEYKAIILVRPGFRRDHRNLFKALKHLQNSVSGTEMQKLNYQVEEQGVAIKEVAGSFLNRDFN
jgi:glycine betaine/choline ABC-type transport system substrate-binding protein